MIWLLAIAFLGIQAWLTRFDAAGFLRDDTRQLRPSHRTRPYPPAP